MAYMARLLVLLQPVVLVLSLAVVVTDAGGSFDFRADLDHPYAGLSLSRHEVVRHGARASKGRAAWLTAKLAGALGSKRGDVSAADVRLAPLSDQAHSLTVGIGTPPQPRKLIVDTGSNLIWTQCNFSRRTASRQHVPLYDPSKSSSFAFLPCSNRLCQEGQFSFKNCSKNRCVYEDVYGSAVANGVLASEAFTFGVRRTVSLPLGFGCGVLSAGSLVGATGILGLSPETLSLITQLDMQRFSYCLTPFADRKKTSPLLFGAMADLSKHKTAGPIQTTSLVSNPVVTLYYYVPLVGISLGNKRLAVPAASFAMRPDGSGGTIVDSGSTVAYLVETAFQAVKKAVMDVVKLPVANRTFEDYKLCFALPRRTAAMGAVQVPPLVLHFDGGAAMVLPRDNYFQEPTAGLMCLAVAKAMDGFGMSIIGNVQQQNMHVLFDVRNQKFSFAPAQCDQI